MKTSSRMFRRRDLDKVSLQFSFKGTAPVTQTAARIRMSFKKLPSPRTVASSKQKLRWVRVVPELQTTYYQSGQRLLRSVKIAFRIVYQPFSVSR